MEFFSSIVLLNNPPPKKRRKKTEKKPRKQCITNFVDDVQKYAFGLSLLVIQLLKKRAYDI